MNIENNCCNGNCKKCGECCGNGLPITKQEAKTIRRYIKDNKIEPTEWFDEKTNTMEVRCPFLTKERTCKIYDVRPSICKTFQCNKEQQFLIENRAQHHIKAYYNHADRNSLKVDNMIDFYWLFYKDPTYFIRLINSYIPDSTPKALRYPKLIQFLNQVGREDIVKWLDKNSTLVFDTDKKDN